MKREPRCKQCGGPPPPDEHWDQDGFCSDECVEDALIAHGEAEAAYSQRSPMDLLDYRCRGNGGLG